MNILRIFTKANLFPYYYKFYNNTIQIANNHDFHAKMKHIEFFHHLIHYLIWQGVVQLKYCKMENYLVDIFTKVTLTNGFVSLYMKLNYDWNH